MRETIITARKLLPEVIISEELIELIAGICLQAGVDGHRADITMVKTAKTIAAYHGRYEVCEEDIKEAAELVLNHRRRRQPFQEQREPDIEEIIGNHKQQKQNQNNQNNQQGHNSQNSQNGGTQHREEVFDADKPYDVKQHILQTKEKKTKNATGRRSKSLSTRGRYVKSTMPRGKPRDIALVDTLRVAAPKQRSHSSSLAIAIQRQDIREKVRRRKIGNTILFVVDASGSMGADQRMRAVKTAVLSLLLNAYQQRDRVGLIAFRGGGAELLLPPTSSVELAEKYLREIPTGGKTPLPHGLMKACEVFKTELMRNPDISPLLVLLSDGRANTSLWGNPLEDMEKIGEMLRGHRVKSIVLDCEHGLVSLGMAKTISQILGAQYIPLEEIKTTDILKSIKCSIDTSFNP